MKVLDRRELAAAVVLIGLHAPDLARVTLPGQYVMVVPPAGEQAATALGIYEAGADRISLLFFVSGKRTAELAELHIGETVSALGPLGNGFQVASPPRRVAIVAGGVGIASVLMPAQTLIRNGARVRLYYGARSAERLVEAQRFAEEGCDVQVATDDGSGGRGGFVTDLLASDSDISELILACGPTPMLRAVGRIAEQRGIPAQLSLEETFACGVGGCWGCVVPIVNTSAQAPSFPPVARGGSDVVNARICKEGPVFWAHELRW